MFWLGPILFWILKMQNKLHDELRDPTSQPERATCPENNVWKMGFSKSDLLLQESLAEGDGDNVSSECSGSVVSGAPHVHQSLACCALFDEFSAFGHYVAAELRKITDPLTLAVAKHQISDVIFQASVTSRMTPDRLKSSFLWSNDISACGVLTLISSNVSFLVVHSLGVLFCVKFICFWFKCYDDNILLFKIIIFL